MPRPDVVYFSASPLPLMPNALERVVDTNPHAIVLLTYDSGRVPSDYLPSVERATKQGVAVFGINETLFLSRNNEIDPILAKPYSDLYEPDSSALKAGLIPLSGLPFDLSEFCTSSENLMNRSHGIIRKISAQLDGSALQKYILTGMAEICSAHGSYEEIVEQARKRLSTSEFNNKIDQIVKSLK